MSRKWIIKALGAMAVLAILAAACGQVLDATPSPEGTNDQPLGVTEPDIGNGSRDVFVPPNGTIDQDGSVSVDNPNPDGISSGPEPSGLQPGVIIEPEPPLPTTDQKGPSGYFQVLALAREDLTQRFGLVPESIQLFEIERVDWPDTSLGNPEPDMFYAQVITSGFKLLLEADDHTYVYHTSLDRVVLVDVREVVVREPVTGSVDLPASVEPTELLGEVATSTQPPVSILDEIDPNECNLVHNINACSTDA
ncbi:MAG: hypothetical protein V3U79_03195 [Dehalococcoidia bacterium]